MTSLYRDLRRWLGARGLLPSSRLARFTAYLASLDLLFFVAGKLLGAMNVAPTVAASLLLWVGLLNFFLVFLLFILLLRWLRVHLMWRLRNRLIVTYVFIGVIPVVLLLTMAGFAGYLVAGQFATFLATADVQSELSKLDAANSVSATDIHSELRQGAAPETIAARLRSSSANLEPRDAWFWYRGRMTTVQSRFAVDPAPPPWLQSDRNEFQGIVATASDGLHLRVVRRLAVGKEPLLVFSSVPLDKPWLTGLAASLGIITLYAGELVFSPDGGRTGVNFRVNQDGATVRSRPEMVAPKPGEHIIRWQNISGGTVPPPQQRFDVEVIFGTPLPVKEWATGYTTQMLVTVQTRPSVLYHRLFLALGEFPGYVFTFLIAVAIAFAVIEIVALVIGIRLTRTVTRSVAELYDATQHIERGDLSYRIQVRTRDQLAALETSFNHMTESLEKLLAAQKESQRLQNELAIAQEVQEQLFPRHVAQLETLEVYGLCRPARTVSGDYYDFLPLGYEKVGLAVGDVSGKGISAALLMATINSAVRAYTLSGLGQAAQVEAPTLAAVAAGASGNDDGMGEGGAAGGVTMPPADLMALLNRQLFYSTPMEKYATLFFGTYDGLSRTLTYSNAGHLPPVVLSADGSVRRLDVGGTVIGLFDTVPYDHAAVELRAGDIFISFSDGITEPENEFGEFGEQRLIELVHENRHLPLDRVADAVITAVLDWIGGAEQPDDITLMLARAR